MMKRTTFVADSCTLVLWGSFFHLASPGHIVKDWSSCPCLYLFLYIFFCLFVSLVDFLSSLSGALESPGTAQTAWTLCLHGSDRMSRSASSVSVRISVSPSRFCVLLLFRSNQNNIVTLLDPPSPVPCNTARWSDIMLTGDKQGQDLPPCRLQRPSLPLKPQGLNGTFTERKTNRRKLLTSTSFFSYFCITGCF